MQTQWIFLGLVLLVICTALMLRKARGTDRAEPPGEVTVPDDEVLARIRSDIEEYGWHLLLISGEGRAGFIYSIGLWETYRHPEVIFFDVEEDPKGFVGNINRFAKRVAAGERFEPGDRIPQAFGKYDGWVREVRPKWYPGFLGTAGAYYEGFDFPA
ncbi:MAG: DUF4262 domain-containing protein, partial [Acidobacteriota bacterium]